MAARHRTRQRTTPSIARSSPASSPHRPPRPAEERLRRLPPTRFVIFPGSATGEEATRRDHVSRARRDQWAVRAHERGDRSGVGRADRRQAAEAATIRSRIGSADKAPWSDTKVTLYGCHHPAPESADRKWICRTRATCHPGSARWMATRMRVVPTSRKRTRRCGTAREVEERRGGATSCRTTKRCLNSTTGASRPMSGHTRLRGPVEDGGTKAPDLLRCRRRACSGSSAPAATTVPRQLAEGRSRH